MSPRFIIVNCSKEGNSSTVMGMKMIERKIRRVNAFPEIWINLF